MGKVRRVINYKLHDLTKCQHTATLFQPSTLKRHQQWLISASGFSEAIPHVEHGQCQWEKKLCHTIKASNFCRMSTCGGNQKRKYVAFGGVWEYSDGTAWRHVDILQKFEAFILWHSFFPIVIGRVRRVGSPRRNRKRKSVTVSGVWELRVLRWNNLRHVV